VTFQLDVGWATIGGEDPVALIQEFGKRIELLHVKDVADLASRTQTSSARASSTGPASSPPRRGRSSST
jgi:sugar phosphate isomerase/epimerase